MRCVVHLLRASAGASWLVAFVCLMMVGGWISSAQCQTTWDLATDFTTSGGAPSQGIGPNGAWAVGWDTDASGANEAPPVFAAYTFLNSNWMGFGYPGFQEDAADPAPGIAKNTGADRTDMDWPAGKVVMDVYPGSVHQGAVVQWTSPHTMTVDMTLKVWRPRNLGDATKAQVFLLRENSTADYMFIADTESNPTSASPNTQTFTGLAVNQGDVFYFQTWQKYISGTADIEGLDWTITEEPGSERPATPVISPSGGYFESSVLVTITEASSAATVHYTIDGTDPTLSSPTYTAPFTLTQGAKVKAIAFQTGFTPSFEAVSNIVIGADAPVFSPGSNTFGRFVTFSLSDSTPGAVIHYTTDGSTPTTSSTLYSAPVTLTSTATPKAIAVKGTLPVSPVSSATYTIVSPPMSWDLSTDFTTAGGAPAVDIGPDAAWSYGRDNAGNANFGPFDFVPFMDAVNPWLGTFPGFQQDASHTVPGIAKNDTATARTDLDWPAGKVVMHSVPGTMTMPAIIEWTARRATVVNANVSVWRVAHIGDESRDQQYGVRLNDNPPYFTNNLMNDPPSSSPQTWSMNNISVEPGDHLDFFSVGLYSIPDFIGVDYSIHEVAGAQRTGAPQISPAAGTYAHSVVVSMTAADPGATIRYTTNGTDPTTSSPLYAGPFLLTANTTIKAKAFAQPFGASNTATAAYTVGAQTTWDLATDFVGAKLTSSGIGADGAWAYGYSIAPLGPSPSVYDPFVLNPFPNYSGNWLSNTDGGYDISDANPVPGISENVNGNVASAFDWPVGKVCAHTNPPTPYNGLLRPLIVQWTSPAAFVVNISGDSWKAINQTDATRNQNIALRLNNNAPLFTQVIGGTYSSGSPYTFSFNSVKVEKGDVIDLFGWPAANTADAVGLDLTISSVVGSERATMPVIAPGSGVYASAQQVTITDDMPTAVIRYTTNGLDPTSSSTLYTGPITVSSTTTLKAIAFVNGLNASSVARADYAIGTPMSVSGMKQQPDNTFVLTQGQAVTGQVESGRFGIEQMDRASGIEVLTSGPVPALGTTVDVAGTLQTDSSGERVINATVVVPTGSGSVIPLTLGNRELGGMDWNYSASTGAGQKGVKGGRGVNNIGLLATVFGKVTYIDPGGQFFTIWDGSAWNTTQPPTDSTGNNGIVVWLSGNPVPSTLAVGNYVSATGLISVYKSGTDLLPRIRVRTAGDMTIQAQ